MEFITLKGRLTREAERRATTSGATVVKFSLAINKGKDKPPRFYSCSIWGSRGEKLFPYLTKGKEVLVNGDIEYFTTTDGKEYSEVKVASFDFCGSSNEDTTPKTVDRFAEPSGDDFSELMNREFGKSSSPQPTFEDESEIPF